jgi:hypothetical protein
MAKQEGKDKISKLHGYLVEAYDSTPKDVNSFRELMQDPAYAEKIHKALVADEDVDITKDYNTFADKYGLKKKAVSPTSSTTSKPSISQPAVTSQASGTEPRRTIAAPSTALPSDATATAPPVEQLLPAQQAQRKAAQEKRSEEVKTKAYETVKKLKDIQYKQANNIPLTDKDKISEDELRQSEIDLEAANFGTEQDKQLIRTALGDTGQSRAEDMAGRVLKGIFSIAPDALSTVGIISKKIDDAFGGNKPLEQYQTYKWAKGTEQLLEDYIKTNPYYDEDLSSTISSGLGQIIPQLALAVGSGGTSTLTQATLGTLGRTGTKAVATQAGKQFAKQVLSPSTLLASNTVFNATFKDAIDSGADFDTAFAAGLKTGGATALITYLPLENILKSLDGIGAVGFKEYLKNVGKSGLSEGLEEATEQWIGNLTAQEMYDANRKLTDGIYENGVGGAAVGSFLAGMLGLPKALRKRAKETNDPILEQQATEMEQAIAEANKPPVEVEAQEEPELMPNVPVNTQQALGKKIIRRKQQGETDKFVEVEETYENQPNERDASEQEQNLIKEGVIAIDTTQQPVEEAPVEDPIQTAQTILNTADTSGGPVTAIQVGQAADAVQAAVDAIEGKAPQPTVEPTPSPIEQAVADEGISTEPITDGERPTRTLEGIYVTPETDAQILYQSNKGGTLLKQPDGSLTAIGNQSVKELLQEAAENDPVIFDNGRSVEVDTDNITSGEEMFDALMQSDNPIDIADAYTYAEGMPSEVISNAGSREQALSNLIYNLTPADLSRYGKGDITQYPEWVQKIVNKNKDKTKSTIDVDIEADKYENFGFTPEDVTDHIEFLSGLGDKDGPKKLRELLSDEEVEVNTARDEAAQRFQELTGAKLTPELARAIANSNPRQEQTVYGQDEEGNLLFSEPRTQVDKGEISPETDKFRGLTKRQVNQRKVKDKVTKRAEAFAQEKLDKYQEDNSDANLKEAVNALVKLFKQTSPVKKYKNSTVANFVEERIGNVGVELGIKIEKLTNEALNPKPKDRFDPTLTGKKKTTKQVLGIPLNSVLQRLINEGRINTQYKTNSQEARRIEARRFIESSTTQEVIDYLNEKKIEGKYPFVAEIFENYLDTLINNSKSLEQKNELKALQAKVVQARLEVIGLTAEVLGSAKIFKEDFGDNETEQVKDLRNENAKALENRLGANDKKEGIELAQAEAKRIVDEEQANLAKDLEMAKKDALLEAYKQALAKVRRELGQKVLENAGLRKTTPETAEELEREINKLNKVIIEQANKAKKAPSTTSKAKETTTKEKIQATKTRAKEIEQKITSAFADGKLFDKTVARGSILPFRVPVLSSEGDALIREYVKVKAKELGFKVQAIAESLYSILPQELKDVSTPKDWEELVAKIQGEAYSETVGDGVEALNQRISNDVQERILKGEQKPKDAIEDVIAELYKIYRERTIASDKKPIQPKTANELIAELLMQTEQARSVWEQVQSIIDNKYKDQPKVMEALSEYFAETPLKLPVSKKKVKQAVKEYFQNRGATLEELIRDRVRIEKETGANTRQAILNVMPDLPIDLVNDIVNAIETETEAQAKVTADRIIDRYFDDTVTSNREPKPIQVQILSDIALANYADKGRVIEGINRKYGTDIRTEEELTDLEAALDNATTPTQVREALTDFARWTPEGAKLAGRVTKTEANRIGEAENNTGLDPVSLTLKALHDVAKQNKAVEAATKKEPTNVIDTMRAVLDMQNKGDAALIWETAKAIVNRELEARFANDPEGLANAKQQIAEYFGHTPLEMAIPKKDFAKAVNQKLKELLKGKTLEQAITDFDDIQAEVNVSLTEMLTDGIGLDPNLAAEIATQVENATQQRINRAAQNIAKRLQPKLPKAKAARTPLAVRIAQALALKGKGVTDEEINKIIEERYGVFIPESALNGLEIAAKEAAVAFKEGGATSTAYKAAAQRFEIELAKATKDTKLEKLEKLNTATNAALLSGPAGRIADVVSNIALTAIELAKTGLEIPLNFKKADWKRWKAKLRFAQVVGQGAKQGSKIAKLQLQGKITDINRYTADSSRNIEAMIERSTGLPKAYLKAGKWIYRIMAATDSLFASEIAYQKALFDLIIATNENAGNMSAIEMAEDALQQMYGNTENQDNAAFKAYVETFGQAPTSTTQAEIDQQAKAATGGDKGVYQARKLEILQNGIDESIKNEARRTANIQAYKGEQFGTLGLLSDKITQFTKGVYPLENISRFSGTAFKIMNTMLDYSLYGFVRASGRSLGNTVLFKGAINKTGGRVLGVRTQTDPNQKLDPETKKAIEKAYRRQQLGRAIFGTILGSAIPALFASLGDEDDPRDNYIDIIGNMDAYPRQYRELLKQTGVKPNSLKIGNVYISFEYILPLALTFAITANGKDLQRAARKLKETNPEKYKDVTDEGINTWYEYMITQYTNPEAIASSFNSMIAQSPLRSFSEGLSTVGDIFKKEAEIDDLVSELAKGLYKQFTNVVIPKIMADFAKYTAIGLDKAGVTDVGAMAMNSKDNDFFTTIAYMSSLGDVTTGAGLTNPKRKIDAFGNIFEKEPNEYRMPIKVFERKFATEPIIQLQIASGVVKTAKTSGQYLNAQGVKTEMNAEQLYQMNLKAGAIAKKEYTLDFIKEDMALLETDRPKAVERIKKTSAAVLEYARLKYLYDTYDYKSLREKVPKKDKPESLEKAYRNIFKARNTK